MWNNKIYGGCVFNPVGVAKGMKRSRENVLKDQISLYEVEFLYGGGYYALSNLILGESKPVTKVTFSPEFLE